MRNVLWPFWNFVTTGVWISRAARVEAARRKNLELAPLRWLHEEHGLVGPVQPPLWWHAGYMWKNNLFAVIIAVDTDIDWELVVVATPIYDGKPAECNGLLLRDWALRSGRAWPEPFPRDSSKAVLDQWYATMYVMVSALLKDALPEWLAERGFSTINVEIPR